eukprot:TRINITY_DN1803_c0_g2_i3.p1 TRINITY_DN1803_c0_g2~~TRINITY_DN1803_c0_g2_i3.p1  ORF type:complete len:249 (+),score=28.39 TRINITY_DN1803_c0_g2_i3:890-1636(+)
MKTQIGRTAALRIEPLYRSRIYLILISLNAALGGFFNGYVYSCFNTMIDNVMIVLGIPVSDRALYTGLITSAVPVGGVIGSLAAGSIMSKIGVRPTLMLIDILAWAGIVMNIIASPWILILGRLWVGIMFGVSTTTTPTYIKEMVSRDVRGTFGAFYSTLFALGVFSSFLMGFGLPSSSDHYDVTHDQWWRMMFALPGLIILIRLAVFLTLVRYDTPLSLMRQRRDNEAEWVFQKIYKPQYALSLIHI